MDNSFSNKFLLVIIAGLLIALIVSVSSSRTLVIADSASSSGTISAVTGNIESQSRDLLYVIDTEAKSLCVYEYQGGKLNLIAARNIKFDMMLDEWRPRTQSPSVKEVYDETRKKIKGSTTPKK